MPKLPSWPGPEPALYQNQQHSMRVVYAGLFVVRREWPLPALQHHMQSRLLQRPRRQQSMHYDAGPTVQKLREWLLLRRQLCHAPTLPSGDVQPWRDDVLVQRLRGWQFLQGGHVK